MSPLFALVLTICSANSDCTDVIKGVYDTQAECQQVIFEERYFNAECREAEAVLPLDGLDVVGLER